MFPPIDYIMHTYECDIALKLVTGMLSQFDLYPKSNRRPLWYDNQKSDMIIIVLYASILTQTNLISARRISLRNTKLCSFILFFLLFIFSKRYPNFVIEKERCRRRKSHIYLPTWVKPKSAS